MNSAEVFVLSVKVAKQRKPRPSQLQKARSTSIPSPDVLHIIRFLDVMLRYFGNLEVEDL